MKKQIPCTLPVVLFFNKQGQQFLQGSQKVGEGVYNFCSQSFYKKKPSGYVVSFGKSQWFLASCDTVKCSAGVDLIQKIMFGNLLTTFEKLQELKIWKNSQTKVALKLKVRLKLSLDIFFENIIHSKLWSNKRKK